MVMDYVNSLYKERRQNQLQLFIARRMAVYCTYYALLLQLQRGLLYPETRRSVWQLRSEMVVHLLDKSMFFAEVQLKITNIQKALK